MCEICEWELEDWTPEDGYAEDEGDVSGKVEVKREGG